MGGFSLAQVGTPKICSHGPLFPRLPASLSSERSVAPAPGLARHHPVEESGENTHAPLGSAQLQQPPGKSTAVCQALSEHVAPGLAGVDPSARHPQAQMHPRGKRRKGELPHGLAPPCLPGRRVRQPARCQQPLSSLQRKWSQGRDGAGCKPTSATGDWDAAPTNDLSEKCSSCSGAGGTEILCT